MVFKPLSNASYSKLLSIGNGGYLDVFFIGWDAAGQYLYVEQSSNVNINLPGTNGGSDVSIPGPIALGQWYHLAVVMAPTNLALYTGTITVYLNGQQVASQTSAAYPLPTYRDQSYIGASDYQDPNAQATYDAVRVYDQALSQSQVQQMAQQYGPQPGRWWWWLQWAQWRKDRGGCHWLCGGRAAVVRPGGFLCAEGPREQRREARSGEGTQLTVRGSTRDLHHDALHHRRSRITLQTVNTRGETVTAL